jgi:hypothetical protein
VTALLAVLPARGGTQAQAASEPARPGYIFLSLISGTYVQDQILSIEPVGSMITLRYSIRESDGTEGPWVRFREPLVLSSAPGEEREYRLIVRAEGKTGELERRELQIRIDKKPPAAPKILPESGSYWDPVKVQFQAGTTISYSIQGDVIQSPVVWDGSAVSVGRPEEKSEYVVQAYAVDAAGNRSAFSSARYSIDTRAPALDVLSPVAGIFGNQQILALSYRNLWWARYTDDGSDPVANGVPYTGPVMLRKQGTSLIRVAAQPRSASRPVIRREVTFTYAPEAGNGLLLDVDSGAYPRGFSPHVLSAPAGSVYCTLWEKTPSDSDFLVTAGIDIPAAGAIPRTVSLRLRALSDAGSWGVEYRYFYFLGQYAATPPAFALMDPEPLRGPSRVQVTGPEDALVAATVDGSQPNPRAPTGPGFLDVTAQSSPVTLKAVAWNGSGVLGTATEKRVAVDTGGGAKPDLGVAAGPVRGSSLLNLASKPGGSLVFEMTSDGAEPAAPGPGSPRLSLPLLLSIPYGMQRTFKIRPASIDEAGRIVALGDSTSVVLNQRPPAQPVLTPAPDAGALDDPATVSIASKAKVFVTMSSDGTTPRDPDPALDKTATSIPLPGIEGSLVSYRIKLIAVDDAGTSSDVAGPFTYVVDLRTPRLPLIAGMVDGGKYNSRQLAPIVADSPWTVHCTWTSDGTLPPAPDARSPLLTSSSAFKGEDGSVTAFKVRLLAVTRNGKRTGEQKDLSFTIDLKPPEVPALSGAPDGSRYARPVTLTPDASPPGETLLYAVAAGGLDAADPLTQGQAVFGPLTFDSPEGARTDYVVRVASVDDAGNRSLYDRRYHFSVDRSLPDDPEASGAPDTGLTDRPVSLTLASASPTIVYELTDDGSVPRLPTPASTPYASPILLSGRNGATVTYRLLARAFSELGTPSRAARIVTVTVDRTVPAAPAAPHVTYTAGDPSIAYLVWDPPASGQIFYRLFASAGNAPDYAPYTGPVSVMIASREGSTITGDAVVKNGAGSQSTATAFSLAVGQRLQAPVMRGAKDGGVVTEKTELRLTVPAGVVRCEISTDGNYPPAVTAASPIAPDPLALDAADGQTVSILVAARAFDPTGTALPSSEVRFGLTIDKTPPDPPVATGIEDGGYYQEAEKVSLLAPEGTIYYSLSAGQDVQLPSQTAADRYAGEFTLNAESGRSVSYRIVAFTVDDAGNRSRETRSWIVTIDQQIVYVSPSGNDYAEGSRAQPVQSLGRALDLAGSSSRKTILAAMGQYALNAPIEVHGDVAIIGGMDPSTWISLGFERWSTLIAGPGWKGGDALMIATGGRLTLRGIEFVGRAGSPASLLAIKEGEVSAEKISVRLPGTSSGSGILVSGGSLALLNCALQASGSRSGSLLSAVGGTVTLTGTECNGPEQGVDFACLDLADAKGVVIQGATINPGSGQKTRGIRGRRVELTLRDSQVQSGAGSIEAVALDLRDSIAIVEGTDLSASAPGRSPAAILSNTTSLRVSHSRISVAGIASAVGISVRGGELVVSRSTLRGAAVAEYVSLARVEDAQSLFANNILVGGNAGESICILSKGGKADLVNNTIIAGTGATLTAALFVQGDQMPRIINNIISRSGPARGNALVVIGAHGQIFPANGPGPVILTNSFSGWQRLVHVDYAQGVAMPAFDILGVDALNSADGMARGGAVHGNIAEAPAASFRQGSSTDYQLAPASACIDAGTDITDAGGPAGVVPNVSPHEIEIVRDFKEMPRPAAVPRAIPGPPRGWDIGAYEYSD